MTADSRAHPWPDNGRKVEFRFRRGVWALARPWYMTDNKFIPLSALTWFSPIRFWFPFFTLWTKHFHWYVGFKPITVDDPKFPWRELDIVKKWRAEGRLFVQLSWTWGFGDRA